jgi:hypothetical protein
MAEEEAIVLVTPEHSLGGSGDEYEDASDDNTHDPGSADDGEGVEDDDDEAIYDSPA